MDKAKSEYYDRVHRLGRISGLIVLILILAIPAIISFKFNIFPPAGNLFKGIYMVCIIYIPICIAEFLTYTPMLGTNASYLVFVTGNLTNLKIPCAITCMENADVKPQTEEGEVIAGIAVAVSSIVTIIIVFIGMLLILPFESILNSSVLKPAFDNIMPALFGALAIYWIQKQWKLAVTPIVVTVIIFMMFDSALKLQGVLVPVMGVVSLLAARFMYKKNML